MIIKIVNVMYFFLFDNSDSKTTYGFKSFSINIPRSQPACVAVYTYEQFLT